MNNHNTIHTSAIIDPSASVAEDVEVGPWTLIGPDVTIGPGTKIESHVVIKGPTVIGANNHIFQFSTVGEATTDLKYQGEPTRLVIGDNNVIREGVTIHRGTVQDRGETTIGNDNLFMAYAHIAHDCVVGDHCIFVNNASLAGHVHVGDWVILGGYTLVYQFCRIGDHAFTGYSSGIHKDIPPFVLVNGQPATPRSINSEGLKRRGYSKADIAALLKAFKLIYRRGLTTEQAIAELSVLAEDCKHIHLMIEALQNSKAGIVR